MEFGVLDELIEWESWRVAAAFGVKKFALQATEGSQFAYRGRVGPNTVRWTLRRSFGPIGSIQVGKGRSKCGVFTLVSGSWQCSPDPLFNEQMARGLYCLGIEDEHLSQSLNCSLTAHEKLELRLSLPRQFWPRKWLVERANNDFVCP